jgi:mono/diheme cytochrome c family protein
MSAHKPQPAASAKPKCFGWIAEFDNEHDLMTAARKVRDSGYTKTDAYTPFAVHGIDEALGIKPTILPFIVLVCAFCGLFLAIGFQCWSNGYDYKYIISGKPFLSIPAFIPVTFETTVLFSTVSTFFAMWLLNRLPTYSNALFANPKFDRVTNDRFFLHVDSRDKYYNRESVRELLSSTSPLSLEEVIEDSTPDKLPTVVWMGVATLLVAALVPLTIVANMRAGKSELPRWHVFFDMDFQPKKKAQSTSTLFADSRSNRPQVVGTVARGQLVEQDPYYLGYDPSKQAAAEIPSGVRLVSAQDEPKSEPKVEKPKAPKLEGPVEEAKSVPETKEKSEASKKEADKPAEDKPAGKKNNATKKAKAQAKGDDAKSADKPVESKAEEKKTVAEEKVPAIDEKKKSDAKKEEVSKETPASTTKPGDKAAPPAVVAPAAAGPNLPWLTEFPAEVSEEMLVLGKTKFEITCSVCHGYAGAGDGLVHRRAEQLQQGYWLPPTSLHEQRIQDQAVGNLFYTITNGKGKMASYAAVLTPKERWAIVMYVKALQRSRNAKMEDVPVDQRAKVEELKKAD